MNGTLVVVGDTLLDRDIDGTAARLAPDAPVAVLEERGSVSRPGGAGLAACLATARVPTVLVTALGADEAGEHTADLLADAGVGLIDLGTSAPTPEKIRLRGDGHQLLRLDRGNAPPGRIGPLPEAARRAIRSAGAVLVSDYARGVTAEPSVRASLVEARQLVWDPHPRGSEPVPGCTVVTPNRSEARQFAGEDGPVEMLARRLRDRWRATGVAVTLGASGAVYVDGSPHPLRFPASPQHGDACGAGDRFAVTVATGLGDGALPSDAVGNGVAEAAAFVAAGGASGYSNGRGGLAERDAFAIAAGVRASGGTVVATGGCFDLLHAGHVAMLEAAAKLGDCLVVCINSDDSVRRLKGDSRPLNRCEDRVAVLESLACVDAVAVFDEDDPTTLLDRLRPDVWAKGGDYGTARLLEADVIEAHGGTVAILPYLRGRSTSTLIEMAARR